MTHPPVHLSGLRKAFGGRSALDGVGFEVRDGEIFGLLGHNGAGKSTTLGILLGMVYADAGEARIGGFDVVRERAAALGQVGAIFEAPAFYEYMSGWHNLRFLVSLSGRWLPEAELERAVEMVGLAGRIHDPVRTYSHGMRQRLGLAQALLPRPRVLILDEPTDGLDPLGIREMREMIRRLRAEQGLTVILSSHLLAEVEQLCDRVAILHQGRLVFCGEWKAGPRRYRIECEPAEAARAVIEGCGLRAAGDVWEAPEGFDPAEAAGRLVAAGLRLRALEPLRETLEDFYLRAVRP
ncbi:MAG: ABC transporter ATP-binding protein [Terrimicrobiaceae bacterium]|nr:ABC transporter ATP-binding protein [Terrimicrobiaceae bacterium]